MSVTVSRENFVEISLGFVVRNGRIIGINAITLMNYLLILRYHVYSCPLEKVWDLMRVQELIWL